MLGKEGVILRITIIPTIYYILFAGAIAYFSINIIKVKDPLIMSDISNEKFFSGPMGMGLNKSYEMGIYKFCIYNTIDGPIKIKLKNNKLSCPLKLK